MTRSPALLRSLGALSIALAVPLAVSACGAGEAIGSARNAGVCSALQQGLDTVTQNLDQVQAGATLPPGTTESVQQALSSLRTAASTATGQLASELVGLETAANKLIAAVVGGNEKQINDAKAAVMTDIESVKAQCAS